MKKQITHFFHSMRYVMLVVALMGVCQQGWATAEEDEYEMKQGYYGVSWGMAQYNNLYPNGWNTIEVDGIRYVHELNKTPKDQAVAVAIEDQSLTRIYIPPI